MANELREQPCLLGSSTPVCCLLVIAVVSSAVHEMCVTPTFELDLTSSPSVGWVSAFGAVTTWVHPSWRATSQ